MNITDPRVVEFRCWAARQFGIEGPFPDPIDVLGLVMAAVDTRERAWQEAACDTSTPENTPEFIRYLHAAMEHH